MSAAQIDVPVRTYRTHSPYFMPEVLANWLKKHCDIDGHSWSFCGSGSWGDGRHADGTSNVENSYQVRGIKEVDCLAFKIQFPECKIHFFER